MDEAGYHNAIAHHLRVFTREWLQQAREDRRIYAETPRPHPEYPLPQGFPFTRTSIRERFHWIDTYGLNEIRHAYDVTLQHHCIPSYPQRDGVESEESLRFLWIITFGVFFPTFFRT